MVLYLGPMAHTNLSLAGAAETRSKATELSTNQTELLIQQQTIDPTPVGSYGAMLGLTPGAHT